MARAPGARMPSTKVRVATREGKRVGGEGEDINVMFTPCANITSRSRACSSRRESTTSRFERLPSSTRRRGNMKTACLPRAATRGRGEG